MSKKKKSPGLTIARQTHKKKAGGTSPQGLFQKVPRPLYQQGQRESVTLAKRKGSPTKNEKGHVKPGPGLSFGVEVDVRGRIKRTSGTDLVENKSGTPRFAKSFH